VDKIWINRVRKEGARKCGVDRNSRGFEEDVDEDGRERSVMGGDVYDAR